MNTCTRIEESQAPAHTSGGIIKRRILDALLLRATKLLLLLKPGVASYHPGLTPEAVAGDTGFSLDISEAVETPAPTAEEVGILREVVDAERIFLR